MKRRRRKKSSFVPGPRVLVVVTGSIAAYKACELLRRLQDRGADVRVAMTPNAAHFVSPMTFAALSGHRVLHSSFDDAFPERIAHVRWAEESEVLPEELSPPAEQLQRISSSPHNSPYTSQDLRVMFYRRPEKLSF